MTTTARIIRVLVLGVLGAALPLAAYTAITTHASASGPYENPRMNTTEVNYSKSGRPYICAINAKPITDDNEKMIGYIAYESDVTDLRKQEEHYRKTMSILEETSKMAKVGGWDDWEDEPGHQKRRLMSGPGVWRAPCRSPP